MLFAVRLFAGEQVVGQTAKCGTMNVPCSLCEAYAESASAYCCRENLNDQKECSESELRVIWTPKASIHHGQCMQSDEVIAPSVTNILGEKHAEIFKLNLADNRYYCMIGSGRFS